MPGIFDKKIFNADVFAGYVGRIPNTKRNALIQSRAIRPRPDLAAAMKDQVGGNYISTQLEGLISGSVPQNYDGQHDMESTNTETFNHSRVVVGRMNSWTEKDFTKDITGGKDWMEVIAQQVSEYWMEIDQDTILSILKGVFNMTGKANREFVKKHTYDVTRVVNSEGKTGCMDATTLNTGMQRACGDNKSSFSMAMMHSTVSTNLENLKLLTYLKYNDGNGMEREIGIATLNGRLVLIDDDMPVEVTPAVYSQTADEAVVSGKEYYIKDEDDEYEAVVIPNTEDIANYYELVAAEDKKYTTYVLGEGAIEYTDCGAAVPYEVGRDPKTNGGQDTLYSRQRKCFSPYGISFTQESMATASPEPDELEMGANWTLVSTMNKEGEKKYISHKAIPIARIISKG